MLLHKVIPDTKLGWFITSNETDKKRYFGIYWSARATDRLESKYGLFLC